MADPSVVPTQVTVDVNSTWYSKVNWTQTVGLLCTFITIVFGNKYEVPPEVQVGVVAAIQGVQSAVTWFLRTYHTTTITPDSAKRLARA